MSGIQAARPMASLRRHLIVKPLRRLFRLLVGRDIREVFPGNERYHGLEGRIASLERLLDLVVSDPHLQWLYRNRTERMDATLDIFPEERREFHMARYRFALPHAAGQEVADIACGTGYGTELLLTDGQAKSVIGVDLDPDTIRYAEDRHRPENVSYRCASGDATGLPDASLDVIVSFETIEHVPCDERLLDEFARLLRPGGTLVVSTPNDWALEASPHHVRVYDRASFEALLKTRFEQIELFNQNSGSGWEYNHDQPPGICLTNAENQELAECFLAICKKPG